jgi:hypothetical protein
VRRGARRRATLLGLWIALIFAMAPVTRPIADAVLGTRAGAWAFGPGLLVVVGAGTVVIARGLARRGAPLGVWALLALAAGGYLATLEWLTVRPIERIHLPEYGILAALAWWALRGRDVAVGRAHAGALAIALAVGLADEVIQLAVPRRFFDWRDVVLNGVAGLLALLVVAAARTVAYDVHRRRRALGTGRSA